MVKISFNKREVVPPTSCERTDYDKAAVVDARGRIIIEFQAKLGGVHRNGEAAHVVAAKAISGFLNKRGELES